MTLVAGKRRNLLMAGDDDEVYHKKPQRYAEDHRAAFNLRSRKSEAEVTNNKILRSTYCTTEANY